MRYAMIMAGGVGSRLWPMSRRAHPKQLLRFIDGQSLLSLAEQRIAPIVPSEQRFVCINESLRREVRQAVPGLSEERILGEPLGQNTMNAVGLTAAVLASRDPDAVFAVLTADHIIDPPEEFARRMDAGFALVEAERNRFVTFAITPTWPSTGFGYVERGDAIDGFDDCFHALQFHEKPDEATAKQYLAAKTYGWNSGMFVLHAGAMLEAIEAFRPDAIGGLRAIGEAWDTDKRATVLQAVYPHQPNVSIDVGVMEPASKSNKFQVCTVPMNVSWVDVGSWPNYGTRLDADDDGNRTNAKVAHLNSKNVLAVSDDPDHTITTIGCEDLIVIHTRDATMVCPASKAQEVGDLAKQVDEHLR